MSAVQFPTTKQLKENKKYFHTSSNEVVFQNGRFQVLSRLESRLNNFDCQKAITNGHTICLSNKTRILAVLDKKGNTMADFKLPVISFLKKENADNWSIGSSHSVKETTYFTLVPGGRFIFRDLYCFNENEKTITPFFENWSHDQNNVIAFEPRFYEEHMLTGDVFKHLPTTYKLYNLVAKKLVAEMSIEGAAVNVSMQPDKIVFMNYCNYIASYDYNGNKLDLF